MSGGREDSPILATPRQHGGAGWLPHIAALLVYTLLAVLSTWPLALHLSTHLPAIPGELGQDVWQNVWNAWWVHQALLVQHTNPYTTEMLFYPQGASLYMHSLVLPHTMLGLPLHSFLDIVPTYNLLTLAVLVLAGYGPFLLARHLTHDNAAALVAGAVVLCSPQRLFELRAAQMATLSDYGVPLSLLCVLLALRSPTWRMAVLVGLALLLTGLNKWYHLFHVGLALLPLLVWWMAGAWRAGGRGALVGALAPWGRMALATVLVLLPFLAPAVLEAVTAPYARKSDELVFSADLSQFIPGMLGTIGQRVPPDWWDTSVLFAAVPLVIALGGVVLAWRASAVWVAIGGVCLLLSLGPTLLVGGHDTGIPMPYALFRALPVVDTLRAPVRINAVTTLMIALVGAVGLAVLARRVPRWGAWGGALVLVALVALETVRLPFPLVSGAVSPVYRQIAQEAGQWSVLELPLNRFERDRLEMYTQTYHGKYILTGLVSRSVPGLPYEAAPPLVQAERADLRADIVQMSPAKREQFLRALRVRYLVVRPDANRPGRDAAQVASARQALGPLTRVYSDTRLQAYRLDRVAAWLDGAGRTQRVAPPLFAGLDRRWEPMEPGPYGLVRWLPPEGAGVWVYTPDARPVVLHLSLYSLPGERPLEVWLNGEHTATLSVAAAITPRTYAVPLHLPAGTSMIELYGRGEGVSPRALGLGDDTRPLLFSVQRVEVRGSDSR